MDAANYQRFGYLDESEAAKFVRRFRDQPHDGRQVMHTLHEPSLRAFLAKNGLRVRYDPRIESKTPDWCVLDDNASLRRIVEVANFNPSAETSQDVAHQLQTRGFWSGWFMPNSERLYDRIWKKASRYRAPADRHDLSYVIALFGNVVAMVIRAIPAMMSRMMSNMMGNRMTLMGAEGRDSQGM